MQDANFVRAVHLLKKIQYPIDLIEMWKNFDGYQFSEFEVLKKNWQEL